MLTNRSLLSLWIGQSVAQSATSVFDLAILWLVISSTGSTLLIGIVSAAIYFSQIAFGLTSGVYIDRFNRRDLLITANLVQGCLAGLLSILFVLDLLNFIFLVGTMFVIYGLAIVIRTSANGMLPGLVQRDDLAASNSLFSLTSSFNTFLSFTIGGLVVAAIGIRIPVTYGSLAFFGAAGVTIAVPRRYGLAGKRSGELPEGLRKEIMAGFRHAVSDKFLWQIVLFGSIVNLFGTAALTLTSPYARIWIHGGADTYGFLLAAFSGGGIVASSVFGKLSLGNWAGKILLLGMLLVGVSIVVLGLVTAEYLAILLWFQFGFWVVFANLPVQVLLQVKIPKELFGRVYAFLTTAVSLGQPFAALAAGSLASLIPIGATFLVLGAFIVGFSFFAYFALIAIRDAAY